MGMSLVQYLKNDNGSYLSFVPPNFATEDENGTLGEKLFYCVDGMPYEELMPFIAEIENLLKDEEKLEGFSTSQLDGYSDHFKKMIHSFANSLLADNSEILDNYIPNNFSEHKIIDIQGFSGSGKTTLISQLLGFPVDESILATATGKTTVGSRQFIVANQSSYQVAATFISHRQLETYINNILRNSAKSVLKNNIKEDEDEIIDNFLIDSRQQFRMRYILGDLAEEDNISGNALNDDFVSLFEAHKQKVNTLISEIELKLGAYKTLEKEEKTNFEKKFDQDYYNSKDFIETKHQLIQLIKSKIHAILDKFEFTYEVDENNWINAAYFETTDKETAIEVIKIMSSNDTDLYGSLLTPVIQSLRAVGQFYPTWLDEQSRPSYQFIFNDNMGLDHILHKKQFSLHHDTQQRIQHSDKVILVNNGRSNPDSRLNVLFEHFILTGQIDKLILCHTHMDELNGGELKKKGAREKHVKKNMLQVMNLLNNSSQPIIEDIIDNASFYFSQLDKEFDENEELSRLYECFNEKAYELKINTDIKFDESIFTQEFKNQIEQYQSVWKEYYLAAPWQTIKAFNNAYARNSYTYINKKYDVYDPLNDFKKHLYMIFFYTYKRSMEGTHLSETEINQIQQEFNNLCTQYIDELALNRLVKSKMPQWIGASKLGGPGSTDVRRGQLTKLFKEACPISPSSDNIIDKSIIQFHDELLSIVNKVLKEIEHKQANISLDIRHTNIVEV